MDIKKSLQDYPDISFIEDITLERIQKELITDFQQRYEEITKESITLAQADPFRLILYACCLQIYQAMQYIDNSGKLGLLKYSYGDVLENLGALKEISRLPGAAATVRLRFTLSAQRPSVILIPAGSRVTAGDQRYFETSDNLEIPAGSLAGEVNARCKETGVTGNGYDIGELNVLVDPIAYVAKVENVTVSSGGAERESDDSLAERIYLAPASYSTAGPDDAYEYWVKTFEPAVEDVRVESPTPGMVDIRFVLQNGELPSTTIIEELQKYLMQEKIRPLTDNVVVQAPDVENYTLDFTYYINNSDRGQAVLIQDNVAEAVKEYILWQRVRIGRDINPDQLRKLLILAGAKRVEIRQPDFKKIKSTSLAVLNGKAVTIYGGVEDD